MLRWLNEDTLLAWSETEGSQSQELVDLAKAAELLREHPQVLDAAAGADSVVIRVIEGANTQELDIDSPKFRRAPTKQPRKQHEFEIVYDGEDLEPLAGELEISRDALIELHSQSLFRVKLIGFSPGFPYMSGLPEVLVNVARLQTPRQVVPAGSVAIAGGWCGIYPEATPGGWRILGHVRQQLFDMSQTPPNLLNAGDEVTFKRA